MAAAVASDIAASTASAVEAVKAIVIEYGPLFCRGVMIAVSIIFGCFSVILAILVGFTCSALYESYYHRQRRRYIMADDTADDLVTLAKLTSPVWNPR